MSDPGKYDDNGRILCRQCGCKTAVDDDGLRVACTVCDWSVRLILAPSPEVQAYAAARTHRCPGDEDAMGDLRRLLLTLAEVEEERSDDGAD